MVPFLAFTFFELLMGGALLAIILFAMIVGILAKVLGPSSIR